MRDMNYYSAKDMAAAFRTVRNNTIKIAEEIPEDKYSFQAASDSRTVAQTLVHIAMGTRFATAIHGEKLKTLEGFNFYSFIHPIIAEEQKSRSKAEIIQLLRTSGDQFANWLGGLSDEFLAEQVSFPAGAQPPAKTRFEMLLSPERTRDASSRPAHGVAAHAGHRAAPDARTSRRAGPPCRRLRTN